MTAQSPSTEGFRLSSQQEHLWLLHRAGLPLAARCAVTATGALDTEALRKALDRLVERHEILRTGFHHLAGVAVPLQVIAAGAVMPFEHHDLSGLDAAGRERRLGEIWSALGEEPLELERAPLVSAVLATLEPDRHQLLVRLPTLCADSPTLELLVGEIGGAYEACLRGEEIDGAPMQYVDFCEWQHEILESAETTAGREHWRRQDLAGLLEARLPGEAPEGTADTVDTGVGSVPILPEAGWAAAIERLGVRADIFLLACWQALLGRLTGRPEVLVGVASNGRKFAELRGALGPFAQLLPVRCQAGEDVPFRELLRRVEEAHREAGEWQESFTWSEVARPARPANAAEPDFPFAFSYALRPAAVAAAGLSFALERSSLRTSRFDAELSCVATEKEEAGLELAVRYDLGRLGRGEAELLAGRLRDLIGNALAAPEAALGDLESLADSERALLLTGFNDTAAPFPEECCHTLLALQAGRTPEAWAVIAGGERLTYRELHERANRLARFLRARGVGPEVRVGICVGRSPEMVVGILGILKAGGAYVPMDPTYPADRLALMIGETGGPVLLTQERFREDLAGHGVPLVCLDSQWEEIGREDAAPPETPVRPENLAYVIYTSGSTGRPKGVLVSHRNLVHSLSARLAYYRNPVESFLLLSSFAFDSSVAGIFGTLAQGGALVLPEEDAQRDIPRLLELLDHHRISQFLSLPSLYAGLLEAAEEPGRLRHLRDVIVAGEACPPALIGRHQRRLPGAGLYNEYGPTEGTVWCTAYEFPPGGEEVLIGGPIPNMRAYLLNQRLRPVVLGSPGELYIAGEGITRGYHDRPELTAERFVPNPFAGPGEAGTRLYQTGDLARFRPSGSLEFLGRVDHQVKIRGYRIELEEIEAVLGRHPALREVAVAAREDEPGDQRLVAYVVHERGSSLQVSELRAFMAERLPEYMVPAVFVPLDELPLTPNGKVDRRALPAPGSARSELQGAYVAPGTLAEEMMADLWADVLGLEKVGVRDNFFELGGHSLLATQLVSRLREAFRVDLTLIWLFEAPTVERLAARVEAARRQGTYVDELPMERVDRAGELPLSFSQQRLWFVDQLEPGSPAYNVAKSFHVLGRLDAAALERALGEVVRRHEVLRTVFRAVNGRPVQVVLPVVPHALPVADLRDLPEAGRREEVRRLATADVAAPFDLSRGPLLRSTLLRLGPDDHGVLFTMHHIVSDAWSFNLLVREMTVLYEAFAAGSPSPLPDLPFQYADFAAWQRRRLQGEALEVELGYWRRQLDGIPALLALPTDRPRPAVQTFRGGEAAFALPAALSESLKALGRSQGTTLFMTLLGAFQALLGRYSGQEDVCVGTPIAGRNRREVEGLIGFFVNTLVMRASLGEAPTFRQLLRQVRDASLEGHLYQDLPFERLVEELAPERSLDHTPLFQALFALQHPQEGMAVGGLRLGPLGAERDTVKYDLTLLMTDGRAGLRGSLGYRSDLFEGRTAARLAIHLEALIEAAVASPDLPLSELPLLREAERHQLAVEWNDNAALLRPVTVSRLFEEQAARAPEAVAVSFAAEGLTYGELDRRANRLARRLRELGVGPESRVGLMMDRSPDLVTALLGILKAGGAYVPLDPSYPEKRLALMAADAGLALVLSETKLAAAASLARADVYYLDRDEERESLALQSDAALAVAGDPDGLAYVMYTSGSTGRPKGVAVTHRNVVRLVRGASYAGMGPAEVFLQLAPVSFDASTLEIWGPLLNGGRLVLYPERRTSLEDLGRTLREQGVTTLWLTAGLFHQMVEERLGDLATVRQLLAGGDVLSPRHVRRAVEETGGLTLINGYGPTENTTFTCCHPVTAGALPGASVPIGRAVTNTQVYLLDGNLQPVPVGVAGELYTGGAGVARGYLDQPALTAEKFVPSPFGEPGSRLYRTSDLARYLPDGAIEFLGRADQQVKVRGFRIELGEIEAVLRSWPEVADAAVVAVAGAGGAAGKRLVAFVAASGGPGGEAAGAALAAELRGHLSRHLPDFMVPSPILVLDQIPLGPTGKLDRRRLLEAFEGRGEAAAAGRVAPRTGTEERIARIWCEVLDLREVGVHDDFFELGGHSLLATQVLSRLRQTFEKEIPLRLLFEVRTVAELAEQVESGTELTAPELAPISAVEAQVRDLDDLLAELDLAEPEPVWKD
jgi:amino acid adenylation domain-containing protein